MLIYTENSVYELDKDRHRIRRLEGRFAPTPHFGANVQWREYRRLEPMAGGLLIVWKAEDQVVESTLTGRIVSMDLVHTSLSE